MNNLKLEGKIVSVTEYFDLVQKSNLTEEEKLAIDTFENFIVNAITYEEYASDFLKSTIALYRAHINVLYSRGQDKLAERIDNSIKDRVDLQKEELEKKRENIQTRKLSSNSGYISSAIILVVILNLGFIIALTILGS